MHRISRRRVLQLSGTAAAATAALPIAGTPAHDAITARKRTPYSHHAPAERKRGDDEATSVVQVGDMPSIAPFRRLLR